MPVRNVAELTELNGTAMALCIPSAGNPFRKIGYVDEGSTTWRYLLGKITVSASSTCAGAGAGTLERRGLVGTYTKDSWEKVGPTSVVSELVRPRPVVSKFCANSYLYQLVKPPP